MNVNTPFSVNDFIDYFENQLNMDSSFLISNFSAFSYSWNFFHFL